MLKMWPHGAEAQDGRHEAMRAVVGGMLAVVSF
jgi:hypothetical protein